MTDKPIDDMSLDDLIEKIRYSGTMGSTGQWDDIEALLNHEELEITALHVCEYSHKEIAEHLKKSPSALSRQWDKIQDKLKILRFPEYDKYMEMWGMSPSEMKREKRQGAQRRYYWRKKFDEAKEKYDNLQ